MYRSASTGLPPTLSLFDLIADIPGHLLRIKRTMVDISHALEEAAATGGPCQVFSSFQRFSLFEGEAARYLRLSRTWNHGWVFGIPDVEPTQIPNVTAVHLPAHHPLAREWFVVIDGPNFGAALLTADVSGFAIGDKSRQFMGLLSTDAGLVRAASNRLTRALGLEPCSWDIDCMASLETFTNMSNQLMALQEERQLSKPT